MPTRTIDNESEKFRRMPIDFERMGERYKTDNNLFTFPSPDLRVLEENLFYLLRHSNETIFKPRYNFKPEYLSYDVYGTPSLAPIILFVNNIASVEEFFNLPKVVIPTLDAITTMLSDIFPEEEVKDLTSISW